MPLVERQNVEDHEIESFKSSNIDVSEPNTKQRHYPV